MWRIVDSTLGVLNAQLDTGVPVIPHILASHCLCGHLISRHFPLQCPRGQLISRHYAVCNFCGLNARLDIGLPAILHIWEFHFPCGHPISRRFTLQCPRGQPISRHYAIFNFHGLNA